MCTFGFGFGLALVSFALNLVCLWFVLPVVGCGFSVSVLVYLLDVVVGHAILQVWVNCFDGCMLVFRWLRLCGLSLLAG